MCRRREYLKGKRVWDMKGISFSSLGKEEDNICCIVYLFRSHCQMVEMGRREGVGFKKEEAGVFVGTLPKGICFSMDGKDLGRPWN